MNRNLFNSENKESDIKIIDKSKSTKDIEQISLKKNKVNDYLIRKY